MMATLTLKGANSYIKECSSGVALAASGKPGQKLHEDRLVNFLMMGRIGGR